MTDVQENQLSMFRTLQAIRALFAAAIAAIADLDADFDALAAEVNSIKALSPKQKLQTTGVARDKGDVKEDMIEKAIMVAGALKALASADSNYTLFEEVNYSPTELDRMRDEQLPDICRLVHDRANSNLAALAGRGITAPVLAEFMTLITDFEGMAEAPRTATVQKGSATTGLAGHFAEANKIVKERLDEGMKIFMTSNPDLYITYINGRKIIDLGKRKKKNPNIGTLSFHVKDTLNNNLEDVVVSVDDRTGSTDEDGMGQLTGLTAGNKSVRFTKDGFVEKFVPAVIVKDQTTTLEVVLASTSTMGIISGQVTQGGSSAPGTVTLQIPGSPVSIPTDGAGNYIFPDVPPGDYTIQGALNSNPANIISHNVTVVAGNTTIVNFVFP